MESFQKDLLIKLDLETESAQNAYSAENVNSKVTVSKCGEILFSYSASGHFQLNCSFCEQKYFKIKLFAIHILKEHLYCSEDHSIDYLISDNLEINLNDKNNSLRKNYTREEEELTCELNVPNLFASDSTLEDKFINSKRNITQIEKKDAELLINMKYNNRKRKKFIKCEAFECSNCNMKFIRKHNLKQHIINKHKNIGEQGIENNIKKEISSNSVKIVAKKDIKRIICYICGKETSKSDMRQHLKSHDNSRYTHKCDNCGKLFISERSVELHNRNFHTNVKPFQCKFENCDKSFVSEHALTAHHRLHSDMRKFKCSICQKGFLYKYKMDHHIKIYHVNGRSYKCDICGKGYYESYTLERHKVCHSNEKPFACDECPARFPRERSLTWHKQSHTGIKEFKCKICGKEYALYNGIYSHMKTHGIRYSLAYEKGLVKPEHFKKKDNSEIFDT